MIRRLHNTNIKNNKTHALDSIHKYWYWVFLFIFGVLQVYFTIRTSALGAKLQSLEIKTRDITEKNKKLREELVITTSLIKLEEKGKEIGYFKPQKMLYLSDDEFVAKAQ